MIKKLENKDGKRLWLGIGLIVVTILGIYSYFKYESYYPETDDAYVGANLINVATKVSGYLESVTVTNNQLVKKGDVLFAINPIDYQLGYQQALQNYNSQVAQVAAANSQLKIQQEAIDKDNIQLNFAKTQYERYSSLYNANTISKQAYQNMATTYDEAKIQRSADLKKLQQYKNLTKLTEAKRNQAKVALDSAKSNLDYTKYVSPVDGYVTDMPSLAPGEFVAAGQQLFGLVDTRNWWIDANFKETQIARIHPGQKVKVTLDMYDHDFTGVVQSISYASGNTFSLLPAQNATGNWVKVTQRFTVRIKVTSDLKYPLRVGSSAKVSVDTL
jgi:membrane fusion protein (multidrug efflux system)